MNFFSTSSQISLWIAISVFVVSACQSKSPEGLPKYKQKFKAQIASFESQKEKADDRVEDGVELLNGLQQALQNAKNTDKEFERVYSRWENVNKQVENLNKEYEKLKEDANNLFSAMERQTAGLSDEKMKSQLMGALKTTRTDYEKTLSNTSVAIEKLRKLHTEAVEVVSGLEVAVGIGQIAEYSKGLKNVEDRVASIMAELNATVKESKDLYESRMQAL